MPIFNMVGAGNSGEDLPIGSRIIVTTETGAVVKCAKGSRSEEQTVPASGVVTFTIHQSGIWQVIANKMGKSEISKTITIIADDTNYNVAITWRVPGEYQEVEYLKSTGTQYINSGIISKVGDIAEYKFNQFTSGIICATYNNTVSGNPLFYHGQYYSGNKFNWGVRNHEYNSVVMPTTPSVVESSFGSSSGYCKLNGTTIYSYSGYSSPSTNLPYYVFASNDISTGGAGYGFASAELYYMKMWSNGTLVRDFVPCYRKLDSVAGMWDVVSEAFFENAGSGTFIVGGDV